MIVRQLRRPRDEEREKGEREEAMQISEMQTKSKDSNETCARQIEGEAEGEGEGEGGVREIW